MGRKVVTGPGAVAMCQARGSWVGSITGRELWMHHSLNLWTSSTSFIVEMSYWGYPRVPGLMAQMNEAVAEAGDPSVAFFGWDLAAFFLGGFTAF